MVLWQNKRLLGLLTSWKEILRERWHGGHEGRRRRRVEHEFKLEHITLCVCVCVYMCVCVCVCVCVCIVLGQVTYQCVEGIPKWRAVVCEESVFSQELMMRHHRHNSVTPVSHSDNSVIDFAKRA
jgi:hypothetical protein